MSEIKVRLPDRLKKEMERFPEISWPGFLKKSIERKMEEALEKVEEEQEIVDWSVKLQRASRKGRYDRLKEKGLIKMRFVVDTNVLFTYF